MKIHTINPEFFKLDGGAMFGVVPKSMWNKLNPADENNMCNWALRCMLIEDGQKLILIDTGIGYKQSEKFLSYYYIQRNNTLAAALEKLGYSTDQVTDIILTHLHFDHCGGAVSKTEEKLFPTFKNAIYWSNQDHWNWALHPNLREKASFIKENILPLQESGQLNFVELPTNIENSTLPSTRFSETIDIRFVNGHTDKMMLPQVQYKGRTIVNVADLFPSVYHLPIPYVMGYDMFPLTSMTEKELFLKEAIEKNYILYFEHDPINECSTVQLSEKGIVVKEIFTLNDI